MRLGWLDIGQVLFCLGIYGPRGEETDKHAQKEHGQNPAILTEQACSIKDKILWDGEQIVLVGCSA